jgi:hypothetical protein
MLHKWIPQLILLVALTNHPCELEPQSTPVSLKQVSDQVQHYMQKSRGWKHETLDPPTPPGVKPSSDVSIHFWSSEKCLTAELRVEGKSYGMHPVPCRLKLVVYDSPSPIEARTRLSSWVMNDREGDPTPLPVGDKAYAWKGSNIVFLKGRFTFWLTGGIDFRVGDFSSTGSS